MFREGSVGAGSSVLALLLVAACGVPAAAAGRKALVIGNNNYRVRPLTNAVNDARDVGAALEKVGFEVARVENATRRDFVERLTAFAGRIEKGDTVLFFYAGHAVQVEARNVLIPVDLERASDAASVAMNSITLNEVMDIINRAQPERKIVILDSCRSNPPVDLRDGRVGLASPLSDWTNTFVVYSTSPGSVAADNPDGRNSYFSAALAALLPTPAISIHELMNRVSERVRSATAGQQRPWTTGDVQKFYFMSPADDEASEAVSYAQTRFIEASGLADEGRYEDALERLDESLKSTPPPEVRRKGEELRSYLQVRIDATTARDSGDCTKARGLYTKAVDMRPSDGASALEAATCALLEEDLENAATFLQRTRRWGNTRMASRAEAMLVQLKSVSQQAARFLSEPAPAPPSPEEILGVPLWRLGLPIIPEQPPPVPGAGSSEIDSAKGKLEDLAKMLGWKEEPPPSVTPTGPTTPAADLGILGGELSSEPADAVQIIPRGASRALVFVERVAEPAPTRTPKRERTWVDFLVRSQPPGARVAAEADPEQVCTTPCLFSAPPGQRTLLVDRQGYRPARRLVSVNPAMAEQLVELEKRIGQLTLSTLIEGLPVLFDRHQTVHKTPAILNLPEGSYEIRLLRGGREVSRQVVEIAEGMLKPLRLLE